VKRGPSVDDALDAHDDPREYEPTFIAGFFRTLLD